MSSLLPSVKVVEWPDDEWHMQTSQTTNISIKADLTKRLHGHFDTQGNDAQFVPYPSIVRTLLVQVFIDPVVQDC